jgi:predicted nucleotidyltransferase
VARNWDEWLKTASGPASPTEEQDRDRTEARIRDAIRKASDLASSVSVYTKGSHANNTNVRRDSDVDIAVEWTETAYVDRTAATQNMSASELGYSPVETDITPREFRERVERAVVNAFGATAVDITGDKAIHVVRGENSLDADVVPCFALDRFDAPRVFHRGHRIYRKDTGYSRFVDNFPEQNKRNGTAKNSATGRRYKEIVRCLKRLEGELVDDKTLAREYPGYLVECLLYNVPNSKFGHTRRFNDLDQALIWLWETLGEQAAIEKLVEVNELVYLFRGHSDRIPANARDLVYKAWNRLHDKI